MELEAVSATQARRHSGLGAIERRIERHSTAMRGAPFGLSPQIPFPLATEAPRKRGGSLRLVVVSGQSVDVCSPPLQHHGGSSHIRAS